MPTIDAGSRALFANVIEHITAEGMVWIFGLEFEFHRSRLPRFRDAGIASMSDERFFWLPAGLGIDPDDYGLRLVVPVGSEARVKLQMETDVLSCFHV